MMYVEPEVHLIRDTDAGRFLRRDLNERDLITIWDTNQSRWIVCLWTSREKGIVEDLEDLPGTFETGPILHPAMVRKMRINHRPPDYEAHKRRIIAGHRAEHRRLSDAAGQHRDVRRYLKRHNQGDVYFS